MEFFQCFGSMMPLTIEKLRKFVNKESYNKYEQDLKTNKIEKIAYQATLVYILKQEMSWNKLE